MLNKSIYSLCYTRDAYSLVWRYFPRDMPEAFFRDALENTRHASGRDGALDRWKVDGITVHFIEGRKGQLTGSERPSVKVFEAQQPTPKRTEGGKSSKGCSGTTHRARKKRPFRPFRDRRVRHLISLSLTGRYFSVLRFSTLFYLYTRGKTNPLPSQSTCTPRLPRKGTN